MCKSNTIDFSLIIKD